MNNNIKFIKRELSSHVKLVVVTKGRNIEDIIKVIEAGETYFGENKLQEAKLKWTDLKNKFPKIKLHMIGHLQSNKVKEAVNLFDVIETVDNIKLAEKISKELLQNGKKIELFIQVNIGNEPQKYGVGTQETYDFVKICQNNLGLNITGLMCIPPKDCDPSKYFLRLKELANKCGLKELSMGMSADYNKAIELGSTQVRLGRILFT